MPRKIAIIGAGRVGVALGYHLVQRGFELGAVVSRRLEAAQKAVNVIGQGVAAVEPCAVGDAEIVFLTVPDRAIAEVCLELAQGGSISPGVAVFHCSGALPSRVLEPAQALGARVGALHPIQTFADLEQALISLPGSYFGFEGAGELEPLAEEIVRALDGRLVVLRPEAKALYHAAAVFACNYLVVLVDVAVELLGESGVGEALAALLPLIRGTVGNLERLGLPGALTGPVARGDVATVAEHLRQLAQQRPELVDLYKRLAQRALRLAQAKGGIDAQAVEELKRLVG